MLKQGIGHVVNTASVAGLVPGPLLGIYYASKHAVVAISETLHFDLLMKETQVRVSVVCPGPIQTRIKESDRNRPLSLPNAATERPATVPCGASDIPSSRTESDLVAARVVRAIREEQFYVLTHPDWKPYIRMRVENIINEQNPAIVDSREGRLLRMQKMKSDQERTTHNAESRSDAE
jgi:short-subunit dehydrogenase